MKLVPNARRAWRWFSMQAMGVSAAGLAAWAAMPSDLRAVVPDNVVAIGAVALLALGMIGRLVDQPND